MGIRPSSEDCTALVSHRLYIRRSLFLRAMYIPESVPKACIDAVLLTTVVQRMQRSWPGPAARHDSPSCRRQMGRDAHPQSEDAPSSSASRPSCPPVTDGVLITKALCIIPCIGHPACFGRPGEIASFLDLQLILRIPQ